MLVLVGFWVVHRRMKGIRLTVAYGLLEKEPRHVLGFVFDFFFKQRIHNDGGCTRIF